jgi:hypothetical protein
MYIQYVGFNLAVDSRIYNFHVIDTPKEPREFTVQVLSDAFRSASLKLQDGPGICFARLKQALEGETHEAPAKAHLSIGDREIREYSEQHYPHKLLVKKAASFGSRWS